MSRQRAFETELPFPIALTRLSPELCPCFPRSIIALAHRCPDVSRLLTVNGAAVRHDANGNLTAFAGATYSWDVRPRLQSLTKGGITNSFGYNPDDLRARKAVNGVAMNYLLDGESVVSETTGGSTTRYTLQSPVLDQPLARDGKWFVPEKLGRTALLVLGGDDAWV